MTTPIDRQEFLGLAFDQLGTASVLRLLAQVSGDTAYQYLVTPNVDHMVRLDALEPCSNVWNAYRNANYIICDSRVLRLLARLRGVDLPVVPGSDLSALLFDRVISSGDRIAIVGGDKALLQLLEEKFPQVSFVQHCPPMDLMRDPPARRAAAEFIAREKARFTFIAVGSPQQELIAAEVRNMREARGMALCIGAALNFLAGREARAPKILQRLSLEWAFRLAAQPTAMWRRYLVRGPGILRLVLKWRPNPARLR